MHKKVYPPDVKHMIWTWTLVSNVSITHLPNKFVISNKIDVNPGHIGTHHFHGKTCHNMIHTLIGCL